MSNPRYSIIPAGAVTDRRLEGRDLQVLCFLGRHTDKLGWCFLSQVSMAVELDCGRATVQRSLGRLYAAGWVEIRPAAERPHACHAYRVIMDRDDPQVGPSELEIEDQKRDGGCPPVGTSADGVPVQDGHGGAHPYVGTEGPSTDLDNGRDARAREPLISPEAFALADVFLKTIGFIDPQAIPPEWYGVPYRAQVWITSGWTGPIIVATAKRIMQRRSAPPHINYFETTFANVFESLKAEVPQGVATERTYEKPARRSGITAAIDRYIERFEREEREQGGCGEVRETPTRLLPGG